MIDRNTFYGAARNQTLVATPETSDTFQGAKYSTDDPTDLDAGIARVWTLVVGGGFDVNLPPANGPKAGKIGGPVFVVINLNTSSTAILKDADGTTLETILINKACVIGLAANGTSAGIWTRHIQDVG